MVGRSVEIRGKLVSVSVGAAAEGEHQQES